MELCRTGNLKRSNFYISWKDIIEVIWRALNLPVKIHTMPSKRIKKNNPHIFSENLTTHVDPWNFLVDKIMPRNWKQQSRQNYKQKLPNTNWNFEKNAFETFLKLEKQVTAFLWEYSRKEGYAEQNLSVQVGHHFASKLQSIMATRLKTWRKPSQTDWSEYIFWSRNNNI